MQKYHNHENKVHSLCELCVYNVMQPLNEVAPTMCTLMCSEYKFVL